MPEETTALETEMKGLVDRYVVPQVTKAEAAAERVADIQKDLLSKWERGSEPNDQAVKDLEAVKAEREAELNALREDIRNMQLDLKREIAQPGRATEDPFKGRLIKNADALREVLAQFGTLDIDDATRAIDTTTINSAGKLNPDQENQFLDWLVEKQVTLSRIRRRNMRSSSAYLDELVTASRQMTGATEGTAPTVADGVSTNRRTLTTKETIWAEDITRSFLEDNIEQANAESHLMRDLARAFGNDHNDLFWNGDETNSDPFIGINNGVLYIATNDASVVDYDAASDTTAEAILAGLLKNLAYDYAMQPGLTFFMPYKTTLYYVDELTDRGTPFADQVLQNGVQAARYFGFPVIGDPHLNVSGDDQGVLTFDQNLVWGVQRGITVESMWQPRKRAVEVTITARTDANYAKSEAVVLASNIPSTLR